MNPRTLPWLANTLTALLVIALGLQFAWWTWQLAMPSWKVAAIDIAPATAAVPPGLGRQLFGDREGAVATGESPAVSSSVRLKGVFAVDGKALSAAVVNLGGKDQTVRLNQELSPGVKLVEVQPEFIVISRNGVRERIDLDRFMAAIRPGAATGQPAATSFRLNVASTGINGFALSRQELNTVLQDPRQMNFLGRIGPAPSGGVRVEEAPSGSLSSKLGLQPGDIITGINGQPINSPGDLARVYGQFNSLTSIRAEVKRAGAPVMLNYAIQN
jgi:general secretion pathway protein C